jgi:hypothetical protein
MLWTNLLFLFFVDKTAFLCHFPLNLCTQLL